MYLFIYLNALLRSATNYTL